MSPFPQEALSKILSHEQYADIKHQTPYVFELRNDKTALTYYGARHSANPNDSMFEHLHEVFIAAKPDVVFVEGLQSKRVTRELEALVSGISYGEAIERGGEPIYMVKLSIEHGVAWRCPEPADAELYAYLVSQRGFSQSHIAAWQTLHLLPQWQRRSEVVNFKDYTERFRELFKEHTNWPDFDYSYEHAIKVAEAVLGRRIRLENRLQAEALVDPVRWRHKTTDEWTVINRISAASSEFRDEYIVREVGEHLLEGGRILVVYGASHGVMQEPAFRWLFQDMKQ